jgi:predicted branched-subunit amino acid permease
MVDQAGVGVNVLAARLDREALRDIWPIVLGMAPFGLLIGVTIGHTGVSTVLGLGSAAVFFGGSGHLAALTLLAGGAGPLAVLAGVVVVNARFALYAAALQSRFRDQPAWFRWLAPHLLIDQTYALVADRPDLDAPRFRQYWLTAGGAIGLMWIGSHVAGVLLGPVLPEHSPLEIAAPALFVGLLAPQLTRLPAVVAATAAAIVAATASVLPQGAGLIIGAIAGLVAGALVEPDHEADPAQNSDTGM